MEVIKKSISILLTLSILTSSTFSWSQPLRYEEDFIDDEIESSTTWDPIPVDAAVGDLKLKVLSEDEVFRGNFNEKAYVCHPLMKKHANREKQLKKRGLWFYDK